MSNFGDTVMIEKMLRKFTKAEILLILMFLVFYITFVTFLYLTGMMDIAFAFVTWIPKLFIICVSLYFSAKYIFKQDERD
jgi:hypothetical protein